MCMVSLYMLAILCCHTIDWDIFLRYWCLSQIYYYYYYLYFVTTSAHDFYKENYWRDYRVLVQADGTIMWNYGGIFSTTCSLDITNYPFDTQV